ncbi:hypothetical protein [Saccharopolyspora taberi]|uniref:Ferredoxin n=1 Tax=Saccharopolyspora taberi TaxID=60895 RepID=A0ABN3VAN8_9PSEU
MPTTRKSSGRHFWLPVPDSGGPGGTRHAFRGPRWDGSATDTAVCGEEAALAQPSEMDWCTFPTCRACTETLKAEP